VTPTIVLAGPHTPLQVLSSTLDFLVLGTTPSQPSLVPLGGPIGVVFNQAVSPTSVRAALYTDLGDLATVQPTVTVAANVLKLDLGGNMLEPGKRYNLDLHAASLSSQTREYNVLAPVFAAPGAAPVAVSVAVDPNNDAQVIVTFSEPVGPGNASQTSLGCVVFYSADLDGNPDFTSAGEYTPAGNAALKCQPGDPHQGHYLRPDEPSFNGPSAGSAITGFSTRWRLTVRPEQAVCDNGFGCCVLGQAVNLVFSRNADPGSIVRRTNGQPVPDQTGIVLPGSC